MTCPVKSLQIWKDLVDNVGENVAYYLWDKYEGDVPAEYYTDDHPAIVAPLRMEDLNNSSIEDISDEVAPLNENEEMEFHVNTLNVVTKFLDEIGVGIDFVSNFTDQDGNIVENAVAAANFIKGTVDVIADAELRPSAWNKLPEEAAHFWYRLLDTNSELKDALLTSALTDRKEAELRESLYGDVYKDGPKIVGKLSLDENGNITSKPALSLIREEAIGQLIAEAIKRLETQNASAADYSFFKKLLEWVNSIINKINGVSQDPFELAGMKILSSDTSDLMSIEEYNRIFNDIYPDNVDIREDDNAYDFGDETTIEDTDWYKNLAKRFRVRKDIKSATIRKIQDSLNTQQPLSKIKLKPAEKKLLMANNQYENITPELLSFDLLKKKYKDGIALKSPIVLDAKKFDVDLYNNVRELIAFEWNYPGVKTIKIDDFINEVFSYLHANYLLGFANESRFLTYRIPQIFTHTGSKKKFARSINMDNLMEGDMNMELANNLGLNDEFDVQHRKISLRFNDEYVSGQSHFDYSPSAWGNITYFSKEGDGIDSVLIHEIQNDFIEKLNAVDNSSSVKERLTSYMKLPGFFAKLTGTFDQFQEVLNEQINLIESNKPWGQLNAINENIKYNIEQQKNAKKVFNPSNKELVDLVGKNQFGDWISTDAFASRALHISKEVAPNLQHIIENKLGTDYYGDSNLKLNTKNAKIHSAKQFVYRIGLNISNSFKKSNSFNIKNKAGAIKQIKKLESLEKYKKLNEADFKKLYSNYSKSLGFLSEMIKEKQLEEKLNTTLEKKYFNPIVHRLIQTVINEKGKDFDMYFSGQEVTMLTQGSVATSNIYAGPEEVSKGLADKIGPLYLAFSKVNGISLKYVEDIPGFVTKVGGYKVDLSKYNYKNPILFGLNNNKKTDSNDKIRSKHFKDFIGAKTKTVSPGQKISILKRVEVYNKKYGTHNSIHFTRVGESMNYIYEITENWANFDPTQGKLFQLPQTTPSKAKIEELNQKLITMLSSMGVTVEQFNDFMKEYGLDAVGVMEIIDGVARIRYDETRADELTLPEETAHFFIELFGNTEIGKRLIEAMKANDYYKTILGEEFDKYNELYKGDINELAKEAAGKLLANALVSKFNNQELQAPAVQYGLLTRFWNYVKGLFRNVTEITTGQLVSELYSEVAENILSSKYANLRLENIKGSKRYFQISDLALNRLKSALDKTIETTAKRIQILKAKNKKQEAYKDETYLEQLVESVSRDAYVKSAVSYAEFARDKFKRVNDAVIALRLKFANLNQVSILEAATTLRDMHSFAKSYTTSINELKLEVDRILLEEPNNIDYKKVSLILAELAGSIKVLQAEYIDLARPIFAKYLEPFIGAGFMHVDLENDLKFATGDISFAQRWIDSMAEASSPILQLIDVAVKEAKRTAYEEAYNNSKTLLEAQNVLHKAGIHTEDWMYERLSNGDLTGNFVTEYNWGQWDHNRKEFFSKLLEDLGLPLDTDKRNEVLAKNNVLKQKYGKAWAKWFKINAQTVPGVAKIIEEHRKAMTTEEYAVWDNSNITRDEVTGDILFFKGELVMPAELYKSKEHTSIQTHSAKKGFYDSVMKMKDDLDAILPDNFRSGRLAPQLRKDFVERLKSASKGEHVGLIKETLKENFVINEDDVNYGSRVKMTDESNNLVNFLPIYFTKKLRNTTDMSTDVVSTMSSFALMANEYNQMNKIIDILELGRDIVDAREVIETDEEGNAIMESLNILGKKVLKKVKKSNAESNYTIERLNDYYNMIVYGKMKKEGKSIDVFGTKLSSTAMLELLGKYTAISNLGLNLYAGIQNPIVGNTNIRLEGIAGQFVNNKDLFKADALYWKLLPARIAQFGKNNVTNKMDLWYEYFDVNQSFGSHFREMDTSRKTLISKLFKTSSLFVFSSSGEHYMQLKMSLALAYATPLKDKNGKDITLIDAYEVVGNKLQLKEGITKADGTAWTIEDTRKFIRRQNFVNKRLHGIYNDVDKGAMQQYTAMRLVMMFRKFMRPGYNRRWRKADYSFEGQIDTEGYYRTFGRFMGILLKDIRRGEFLIKAHWEEMSPADRANIMRTMGEIGFALALMGTMIALNGLGDDDDDNWLMNMFAYQVYRYQSELLFFIDPRQTFTLLKSPAAAIDQANRLIDLLFLVTKPGYAMEEISRGKWEGYTRLGKASVGTIPLYKTVHDWFSPEDKIIFFKLNQSR